MIMQLEMMKGNGTDNTVHPVSTGKYKVGLFRCKPRTKINNSS